MKRIWFEDNTREEALKYKTRAQFERGNSGAYAAAIKNGWIDSYTWFLSYEEACSVAATKYTYEKCYEEAKKYDTLKDFGIYSNGAYLAAYRNGWMSNFNWLKKSVSKGPWLIYVYEDQENKVVYVGLTNNVKTRHNKHKNGSLKNGVRKFDTLAKYYQSVNKELPNPIIKMENIETEEDTQFYEDWYKNEYTRDGWTVLNKAKTGVGSSSIGGCNIKWTEETLKKEITRLKCVSRGDFEHKNSPAYASALKLGIIDKLFPETLIKESGYWKDYNNHIKEKEANKCEYRSDYRERCKSAYTAAKEYGFLEKLFPEFKPRIVSEEDRMKMSKNRKGKNKGKDNYASKPILMIDKNDGHTIMEFECAYAAGEYLGDMRKQANIWKCLTGKIQSAYGYKWEYKKAG